MGTGIVANLLNQFPYPARWLYWLSVVVFVLNIGLFVLFCLVSLLRCYMWPSNWRVSAKTSNQAMYLGAIPVVSVERQLASIPFPFVFVLASLVFPNVASLTPDRASRPSST